MTKKVLSLIIAAVLLFSLLLTSAFAAAADDPAEVGANPTSGTTGDCEWSLDDTKLTVTGSGQMADYDGCGPWGKDITEVVITDGVTRIGEDSFYHCNNLTSVSIADSVVSIGQGAFYDTAWYDNQPEGLVYAGKVAYRMKGDCPSEVVIEQGTVGLADCLFSWGKLTSIIIPDSVVNIGNMTFDGSKLKKVTLPDSVLSIGDETFSCCYSLKSVTISNSVTRIGHHAFYECEALTSIVIPDSCTRIDTSAFKGCIKLKDISFPDSVTYLGKHVFDDIDTAWYAEQPDGPVYIGKVFYKYKGGNCPSTYTVKDGTKGIAAEAFATGCGTLQNITLPDSLISIAEDAFVNCIELNNVFVPASVTEIGKHAIGYWISGSRYTPSIITMSGYKDTAAEKYAAYNNITFYSLGEKPTEKPTEAPVIVLLGDADGSGEVDTVDATVIQRHATMIAVPYDEDQLMSADIDGDGALTIVDATFIQRYCTKIDTPYAIGDPIA